MCWSVPRSLAFQFCLVRPKAYPPERIMAWCLIIKIIASLFLAPRSISPLTADCFVCFTLLYIAQKVGKKNELKFIIKCILLWKRQGFEAFLLRCLRWSWLLVKPWRLSVHSCIFIFIRHIKVEQKRTNMAWSVSDIWYLQNKTWKRFSRIAEVVQQETLQSCQEVSLTSSTNSPPHQQLALNKLLLDENENICMIEQC